MPGRALLPSLLLLAFVLTATSLDNGLALLPPMGYSTWNDLGIAVNESIFYARCSSLVSTNLSASGYTYCNLDEGWPSKAGRDTANRTFADPVRFPNGMRALASSVHALGLKIGLYTDRGELTCAGFPGSLGHEALDASTYAAWQVDYLKEDNCHAPGGIDDRGAQLAEFGAMRDALNSTGRPILFAVCGGGGEAPWKNISYFAEPPFGKALANTWRIGPDTIEWLTMVRWMMNHCCVLCTVYCVLCTVYTVYCVQCVYCILCVLCTVY